MNSKLSHPILIYDQERAGKEWSRLLRQDVIGVRFESGPNQENPPGMILSLIIISDISGHVMVFDVLTNPEILHNVCFKSLMEADRPIKVMFHPENESKRLWSLAGIRVHGVFDPQTLYMVKEAIQMKLPTRKFGNQRKTLTELCQLYSVECGYDKKQVKRMLQDNPSLFMERPPIGDLMGILYESARCLIPLYGEMRGELDVAVVQQKYSQILEEYLYGGLEVSDRRQFERQKRDRNYQETIQFQKDHGREALSNGDKELLRRGRPHKYN